MNRGAYVMQVNIHRLASQLAAGFDRAKNPQQAAALNIDHDTSLGTKTA